MRGGLVEAGPGGGAGPSGESASVAASDGEVETRGDVASLSIASHFSSTPMVLSIAPRLERSAFDKAAWSRDWPAACMGNTFLSSTGGPKSSTLRPSRHSAMAARQTSGQHFLIPQSLPPVQSFGQMRVPVSRSSRSRHPLQWLALHLEHITWRVRRKEGDSGSAELVGVPALRWISRGLEHFRHSTVSSHKRGDLGVGAGVLGPDFEASTREVSTSAATGTSFSVCLAGSFSAVVAAGALTAFFRGGTTVVEWERAEEEGLAAGGEAVSGAEHDTGADAAAGSDLGARAMGIGCDLVGGVAVSRLAGGSGGDWGAGGIDGTGTGALMAEEADFELAEEDEEVELRFEEELGALGLMDAGLEVDDDDDEERGALPLELEAGEIRYAEAC